MTVKKDEMMREKDAAVKLSSCCRLKKVCENCYSNAFVYGLGFFFSFDHGCVHMGMK